METTDNGNGERTQSRPAAPASVSETCADDAGCVGGSVCVDGRCALVPKICTSDDDCESRVCSEGRCVAATCNDAVLNGDETDVDCGGPVCAACRADMTCTAAPDCTSSVCRDGVCLDDICADGIRNGDETYVDCGGGDCVRCSMGMDCLSDADCFAACVEGLWVEVP